MKKKKALYAISLLLLIVIPCVIVFGKKAGFNFNFLSKLKGSPAKVISDTYEYNNKSFNISVIWGSDSTPSFYIGPNEHTGILKKQYIHEAMTSDGKYYHAYCIDRGVPIDETDHPDLTAYVYNDNFDSLMARNGSAVDTALVSQEGLEVLQDILASGYHYSEDHTVSIEKIKSSDKTTLRKIFVKQILVWEVMGGGRTSLNEVPEACDGHDNCSYKKIISAKSELLTEYKAALQAAREYRSKRNGESQYAPALFKEHTMRWNSKQQLYTTGVISDNLGGFTSNCKANNSNVTVTIENDHAIVTSPTPVQNVTITCNYVVGSGTSRWWYYDFDSHPEWQRIVNGEGGATIAGSFTVGTEEAKAFITKFSPDTRQVYGSKFTLTLKSDPTVKFPLTGNEDGVVLERSGIYILSETVAPHGYEKIRDTELNIDLNTRSITSSNTDEVQASFNDIVHGFEIKVVDNFRAFNISKLNENNEALKGATFKIYKGSNFSEEVKFSKSNNVFSWAGDSGTVTNITDNNYSTYQIRFLEKGIYKVVETAAPSPYILTSDIADRTYYINVEEDYNVFDCGKDSSCANKKLTVNNTLTLKNYTTRIIVNKTGQAGTLLQGVKFIIMNETRDKYVTATAASGVYNYSGTANDVSGATVLVTDANGNIRVNNIPTGTYYLKEIETIDPYVLPEGEDAYTKLVVDMKSDGPTVNNKKSCLESISNATKQFNFYKVDENGNYLAGGKFKIQKYNEDTNKYEDIKLVSVENDGTYQAQANIFKEDAENGKVQFTLSHGIATFIDMTPGTTYRILELEAPKGYEVANVENSAIIKLDRKGYAKGSATIINQSKKLEGSTAQAELIIEIQTGKKVVRYGLIIAGTLILIGGLMATLVYITKKRK